MDDDPRVVMIGFGSMLLSHLNQVLPPESVVVVEDPDVIAKRGLIGRHQEFACLREVLPARYHQDLECVDVVATYQAETGIPVTAVLPGQEYGVPGAAAVAASLGLPGAGPRAAAILTDKLLMREAAAAVGIRVPQWLEVHCPADVASFAAGGPVVLKPANRQGSLGVQLLPPGSDFAAAWSSLAEWSRDEDMLPERELAWRYIAEQLVVGPEYSVEALISDGVIIFLNVTGKVTAQGRHPVELGHVVPAPIDAQARDIFAAQMTRLVDAFEFGTGILHAEWMDDGQGLVFIECAGRIPGDSLVDLIDLAYGFPLAHTLVGVMSAQVPTFPPRPRQASAIRFLVARPGVIAAVTGLDAALACEGVQSATIDVTIGDLVSGLRSSWDRVGEVIVTGATPADASANALRAATAIEVRCESGAARVATSAGREHG